MNKKNEIDFIVQGYFFGNFPFSFVLGGKMTFDHHFIGR